MCGGHSVGLGVALSLSMAALSDRRVIQHAGTPKLLKYSAVTCVYCMERQTRDRESGAGGPAVLEESLSSNVVVVVVAVVSTETLARVVRPTDSNARTRETYLLLQVPQSVLVCAEYEVGIREQSPDDRSSWPS